MIKKPKTKKFYLNNAQQYVWQLSPRNLVLIASRRFGKSEGIIMPRLLQMAQSMPRSSVAIVGRNYKQILTRTLPATLHALNRLGYKEGIHYFVGRKAPKTAGFEDPYIKPRSWDYYMHWYNGSVNPLISQDIPFSSNSLTLDGWIADEARTLKHEKLVEETIPANSGLTYFRNNYLHTGYTIVTDMPTKKSEMWILNEEKKMDKDLLKLIESLMFKIYEAKKYGTDSRHYKRKINKLNYELDFYRRELTLFVIYNILDNLEIVGERYIDDMFRNMTPYEFNTAIMSMIIRKTSGGFYGAMDEKLHYYEAYDNNYLNEFRSDDGDIDWQRAEDYTFDCKQDNDLDVEKPLCIAFDTNININWLIVGQPDYQQNELKTIKSFYVKSPRMLTEVCNEFADYYNPLPNKNVVFYYDHTFLQGKSAISNESFYETIVRVLSSRGYYVQDIYIGQAMKHEEKHKIIDDGFKGYRGLFPKFNEHNNRSLLKGMEQTMTTVRASGWGKDKSGEKKPDTPQDPVEFRTDGGDAWDTLYIGCNAFPVDTVYSRISLVTSFS